MFKKHRLTIVSVLVATLLVGGAVYLRASSGKQPGASKTATQGASTETTTDRSFTAEELAANDGKNGHKCYVAVEDKVYEIDQGRLWKDGEHTTSDGQAHCGLDLTEALKKSPHGKSKLQALTVVGTLKK